MDRVVASQHVTLFPNIGWRSPGHLRARKSKSWSMQTLQCSASTSSWDKPTGIRSLVLSEPSLILSQQGKQCVTCSSVWISAHMSFCKRQLRMVIKYFAGRGMILSCGPQSLILRVLLHPPGRSGYGFYTYHVLIPLLLHTIMQN